ncbi:LexA family transcriptional regulator [Paracidovorax wautersii]|nr:XRE family transcriptional regulator [Paracidovorax wautersii]
MQNLQHVIDTRYDGRDKHLADAAGISPSQITQWRTGYRNMGEKAARNIEDKLGLHHGYLDEMNMDRHAVEEVRPSYQVSRKDTTEHGHAIEVALLSNSASMGPGTDLIDDTISGSLTLNSQFVAEHIKPTKPTALRFLHGYGDSMHPTFNNGDVLLVDTGITSADIDGIYVLEAHGRLFIKRVRMRLDGKFEISSDNATHKTVDVLSPESGHEVSIRGRVLWVWNGKRV